MQILDHPYRILITGGCESRKTNSLLIDKICLYAKDPYEAKYKTLLKKREDVERKHVINSKTFINHVLERISQKEYKNKLREMMIRLEIKNCNVILTVK